MNLGESALHIAAAEAAGAHVHPAGSTVHHHADALHIGRPDTMALAVGMADLMVTSALAIIILCKKHGKGRISQSDSFLFCGLRAMCDFDCGK